MKLTDFEMLFKFPVSAFWFALSVFTAFKFLNIKVIYEFFQTHSFNKDSSLWCLKTLNDTNVCKLKHVCYDTEFRTILFFLGKDSVIKGFTHYSEFFKIQLSSINSHNQFYANLSIINSENYESKKKSVFESKALLFSRFKPNNIMHVFHDDLFPVFLTLELACSGDKECIKNYKLVIHDQHSKGPFFNLYKIFSNQYPVLLNELPSHSNLLFCYEEILIGLVQDSIFYQYGFQQPQGPVKAPFISQNDVTRFTSFVKEKLNIKNNEVKNFDIVLINRKKSRRILNVEEVKETIGNIYKRFKNKVNILVLDLYSNGTLSFIKALTHADIMIGMHGAEMIFSLFMKPKSVVIELFPYGIQPEVVSFVKSLSHIEGSNIFFISWRNWHRNNSVPHPNAHPLFGGISHLDESMQKKIKIIEEVPAVKCCHNPIYLYYMYQDTLVSNDFKNFLNESLTNFYSPSHTNIENFTEKWFHPSVVLNVSCMVKSNQNLLHISWNPPFNVPVSSNVKYNLFIKEKHTFFQKEIMTDALSLQIKIPFEINEKLEFEMWISVFYSINKSKSKDFYLECKRN